MSKIKAITLWQPWASAMAVGAKHIETRSWPGERGGLRKGDLLAIHAAARRLSPEDAAYCRDYLQGIALDVQALPYGAVVCVVRYLESKPTTELVEGVETEARWVDDLLWTEYKWGDYTQRRYGWHTELVHVFPEPVPAKGAQGVWAWEWSER